VKGATRIEEESGTYTGSIRRHNGYEEP